MSGDFVMTLSDSEDDDAAVIVSDDEGVSKQDEEFASGFAFDAQEDDAPMQAWDFKGIRDEQERQKTQKTVGFTSVSDKILRQLEKKGPEVSDSDSNTNSDSESEEEQFVDRDAGLSESEESEDEDKQEDGSDEDEGEAKEKEVEEKDEKETKKSKKAQKQEEEAPAKPKKKKRRVNHGDFADLNLSRPFLRAIQQLGWAHPTPVQHKAIPKSLAGSDLLVNAMTGSGKTAAFMLPVLERLFHRPQRVALSRVLVIAPTRELAAQCHSMTQQLCKHTNIRVGLVVGGLSVTAQEQMLRTRPDIVVATPGRLIDHLRNSKSIHLEDIEILILDEADRLLEKGFADELQEIIKSCPRGRQTMLFSATLNKEVDKLVNLSLNNPVRISIDPMDGVTDNLVQEFVRIREQSNVVREAVIISLCKRTYRTKTVVFLQSKAEAHRMMIIFGFLKLKATELHGNLTQTQRLEALDMFREGAVDFLLCTDLAARGLDIIGVDTVINMAMPHSLTQYIHRVGRTARAGRGGVSVTLVGDRGRKILKQIVKQDSEAVKSRIVPADTIAHYKLRIESLAADVSAVLSAETEEKEFRVAEMEANKITNRVTHRDQIMARPARTWFQTEGEKKESAEASLKSYLGDFKSKDQQLKEKREKPVMMKMPKKDPLKGLSRKKKRRKLMQMEADQEEREMREERERQGLQAVPTINAKQTHAARKAKEEARVAKATMDGLLGPMDADTSGKKKKKRKSDDVGESIGARKKKLNTRRYMGADDGITDFDRRYAKTLEAQAKSDRERIAEAQKVKAPKGGFKSKKKFKRR